MAALERTPPQGIRIAPSPWRNLPVQTIILPFWSSGPIKDDAYAPLEAASPFASPQESGAFKGGLGMIQIVRYHDTPVGPYDELLLVPGYFDAPRRRKAMVRCTRIYVSQRETCWNGRANWNIPKHLARFGFSTDPGTGALSVEVRPPGGADDAAPFFRATVTRARWLPSFPFSTGVSRFVGMDLDLAQPPLPAAGDLSSPPPPSAGREAADGIRQRKGTGQLTADGEDTELLCGTREWRYATPLVWGRAKACWTKVDESDGVSKEGWWPLYKPWKMGLWIEKGYINFQDAKSAPSSNVPEAT